MGAIYKPATGEVSLVGTTEKENWTRMALQYLRLRRARPASLTFTAEDIAIEMLVHQYPKPSDARWWGSVMQRAKRDKIIIDTRQKRLSRAGHLTPVWVYKL